MGTFNDSICSNDGSQGSQAPRKAILDASTPMPEEAMDEQPVKDQSSLSGMRQTQGHYSLHGLAVSQSQMSKEAALTRKDSQKENTPTPSRQRPSARYPQVPAVHSLPHGPDSEPLLDQDVYMDEVERTGAPFNARKAGTTNQDTAGASRAPKNSPSLPCTSVHDSAVIVSGAKGRAKPQPRSNPLKRPRSSSPESQDSFAVLPKEIQEKKYIKQSRTFQMPLSELGRSQDTEEPHSDGEPEESPSFTSEISRTRTRFRDLSVSRTGSEPPTQPQGFQRSSSPLYSSSYPQAQRQDDDDNDLFPTNEAIRESSHPQPLYTQLEPDSGPNRDYAYSRASTQLTDPGSPVATQPQEDDSRIPPFDPYHQSGATSTTSGPRSLLAMVNPRKRWRFGGDAAALAQAQAFYQQTQALYEPQEPVAGPSTYEQTQPSEASNLPDTGRPTSSSDEVPMDNAVEETQPSESSNLPDTGRLLHDSRSDVEELDNSGETQPSEALSLPATGLEADPSRPSLDGKPPVRHARASRREASEGPEPESFQRVVAPSSSPDVPLAVTPQSRQSKSRLAAIEEDSHESQEIPLAGTAKQHRAKPSTKPLSRDDSGSIMPPPSKRARTESSTSKRSPMPAASSSTSIRSQDLVIPSSDPRERELELMTSFKPLARGKSKKGTPVSVTPVRSKDHDQDDSDGLTEHDNDEALTELADDDLEERLASTSKRRKGTSSALKASSRSIRTNVSTPPTRSTSRMKSASVTRPPSSATRVLALWKQDSHYYAGTLYAEDSPGKYVVHFDDGTDDVVDLSKLRRLELRSGDYVLVKVAKPQKATIVDASRCNTSERQVLVRYDDDDGDEEVDTKNLMIPSRSVVSNWKDRTLTADEVVTILRPKSKQSPTPSVLPQVGSCAKSTKRLFAKTGFILTTAPGFADWDKARVGIEARIKGQGGQIFEDWCRVFNMDGKTNHGGKRWVLEKDEFKLSKGDLDRVFLLADDACHKPKFLIALALGIPCVKFDWLYDSVAESIEKEWQSYLLPAGISETLNDARITQMVDYDWGNCPDHIRDIMNNRVPFKLLHEKSILCVLQDVLPGKTSKRGNADSRDAIRMIPRILLCMGATRVEAVDSFTHASVPLTKYDYVVVKDVEEAKRAAKTRNLSNCVAFPWVKECLITGRILPRE